MKRLFAVGLGLAVVGLAGPGRADDKDDNAKLIVGKWEATKADDLPPGSIIEFTKDGKLNAVIKADGQELKLDGTYKVEKDKLTVKLKIGDQEVEEVATIKKLTADVLNFEDKDKKVSEFKKVKK